MTEIEVAAHTEGNDKGAVRVLLTARAKPSLLVIVRAAEESSVAASTEQSSITHKPPVWTTPTLVATCARGSNEADTAKCPDAALAASLALAVHTERASSRFLRTA